MGNLVGVKCVTRVDFHRRPWSGLYVRLLSDTTTRACRNSASVARYWRRQAELEGPRVKSGMHAYVTSAERLSAPTRGNEGFRKMLISLIHPPLENSVGDKDGSQETRNNNETVRRSHSYLFLFAMFEINLFVYRS